MAVSIDLGLTDQQMKDLVGEALLRTLDSEKREILIKGAMTALLTAERDSYGGKKQSPLELAFNQASFVIARNLIEDYLKDNDEVIAQIKSVVEEGVTRALVQNREALVDKISNAVHEGLDLFSRRT